jgi:hypothetical protein
MESRFRLQVAEPAAALGWRLAITLTPTAQRWLESAGEIEKLQALTDLPLRSTPRLPSDPRPHPDPDVFLFAPASANSVAKLALGIADNQALTVLGDALGEPSVTIVVGYQVRDTRVNHPAWGRHLAALEAAGVRLFPMTEGAPAESLRWTNVVERLPKLPV